MEQRQHGLGDVLDDYCPRERRVTNHAVVALVGDEIYMRGYQYLYAIAEG